MIKRIGKCSFGFPNATYEEEFEFPDNYTEEEMEKELSEWANQFVEIWFEDDKEDNESTYEDEVHKEYEYLHWDIR